MGLCTAAARPLKKWEGGHALRERGLVRGLVPLRLWGSGGVTLKIFENIGTSLCNLVHFLGKKIRILYGIIQMSDHQVARKIDAFPCHF